MSGWGTSITGFGEVINILEEIQVQLDDDAVYVAGPTVNYAIHQELGTTSIEARPFLRPASERVSENKESMLERYWSVAPDAGPVEVIAIAVQNEAKIIADQKDVRDTGALIASITYERAR